MSSRELIEGFKNNATHILSTIYSSQYIKLERYVLANNGNSEQAKDIFQEAFVALWRNIREDRFVPGSESEVNGYLYRIAKNKWLDYLRSVGYKKKTALENQHDVAEEAEGDKEQKYRLVEQGLRKLGEKCRDILSRFYFRKQSMADIADAFGWTEASARNNKYRCIQQLRENLNRLNDE
ncbi:RNA polymerase sigma factor [Saccharicrinis sp. FJH54]|uniref:RNA polymerase sigma factor n=1 Tax=Saccharicrinis sp. FJH54 TaxID=3344665 RepID=UPI0035D504DD